MSAEPPIYYQGTLNEFVQSVDADNLPVDGTTIVVVNDKLAVGQIGDSHIINLAASKLQGLTDIVDGDTVYVDLDGKLAAQLREPPDPTDDRVLMIWDEATETWVTGYLQAGDIPALDASKVTSGTFPNARIASPSVPTTNRQFKRWTSAGGGSWLDSVLEADDILSGTFTNNFLHPPPDPAVNRQFKKWTTVGNAWIDGALLDVDIPSLPASKITSGTFANAFLAPPAVPTTERQFKRWTASGGPWTDSVLEADDIPTLPPGKLANAATAREVIISGDSPFARTSRKLVGDDIPVDGTSIISDLGVIKAVGNHAAGSPNQLQFAGVGGAFAASANFYVDGSSCFLQQLRARYVQPTHVAASTPSGSLPLTLFSPEPAQLHEIAIEGNQDNTPVANTSHDRFMIFRSHRAGAGPPVNIRGFSGIAFADGSAVMSWFMQYGDVLELWQTRSDTGKLKIAQFTRNGRLLLGNASTQTAQLVIRPDVVADPAVNVFTQAGLRLLDIRGVTVGVAYANPQVTWGAATANSVYHQDHTTETGVSEWYHRTAGHNRIFGRYSHTAATGSWGGVFRWRTGDEDFTTLDCMVLSSGFLQIQNGSTGAGAAAEIRLANNGTKVAAFHSPASVATLFGLNGNTQNILDSSGRILTVGTTTNHDVRFGRNNVLAMTLGAAVNSMIQRLELPAGLVATPGLKVGLHGFYGTASAMNLAINGSLAMVLGDTSGALVKQVQVSDTLGGVAQFNAGRYSVQGVVMDNWLGSGYTSTGLTDHAKVMYRPSFVAMHGRGRSIDANGHRRYRLAANSTGAWQPASMSMWAGVSGDYKGGTGIDAALTFAAANRGFVCNLTGWYRINANVCAPIGEDIFSTNQTFRLYLTREVDNGVTFSQVACNGDNQCINISLNECVLLTKGETYYFEIWTPDGQQFRTRSTATAYFGWVWSWMVATA